MKYYLDTEFLEDGRTIDLISIALVREDGTAMYACNTDANWTRIGEDQWLCENVLPHLPEGSAPQWMSREQIRDRILSFVGDDPSPQFWAYYADYDWVVFCQLFGRMIDLPPRFPKFCMDLKQLAVEKGSPKLPVHNAAEHDALDDARWNMQVHRFLEALR